MYYTMKKDNLKTDSFEKRVLIKDLFSSNDKRVEIAGWVSKSRDLSKVKFLVLRDISGVVQVTGLKDETPKEVFDVIDKIPKESVVYISGELKNSKQAPGGKEVFPDKILVLNSSEELPIDASDFSKTELPKRLDYRFLDFHRRKTQAIFKIQTEIANSFREFFYNKGYIELQPPCVIGTSSEGGTELFPVQYFEKKAYLAQSPQLYKQMLACSMEKTFTITPVWRAEKHNTPRHINEIRQMDIECAFMNQMDIMKELEGVVRQIVSNVLKKCKSELDVLGIKDLKVPKGV